MEGDEVAAVDFGGVVTVDIDVGAGPGVREGDVSWLLPAGDAVCPKRASRRSRTTSFPVASTAG